ncbi:MAG: energy-coupling factor transporter transmembrane component T, partial [Candidatus Hermodarchaeota archaeon]
YKPDAIHFHPLIGLCLLFLQFVVMLGQSPFILFGVLILILIENIILGNFRGILDLIWAIFPFLLFLGLLTFIFAGLSQAILLMMRLLSGALAFSFFFAITNPSDLTRVLEKMKIPSKWALLPSLSLTLVPRVAKDAEETFETLLLRGEIKGYNFFRWLPRTLAIFIASVLYRSELLSHSLYYRGFGIQRRTHYRSVKIQKKDLLRLLIWLLLLIVVSFGIL